MINYIEGDLFANLDKSKKICIPHVCNCLGKMGSGFVVPLAQNFPKAKEEYLKLENWKLGTTQFVNVSENITVANMIAQTLGGERPLFYNHLVQCMEIVVDFTKQSNSEIISPMFGSQLAKGNWLFIQELINDCWLKQGLDVTIFYLKGQTPIGWTPK